MRLMNARRWDGGVELQYFVGDEMFVYHFHRTVLGVSFVDGINYACVVGERVIWPPRDDPRKRPPARIYVVLDEVEMSTPSQLFQSLVELKDRYACSMVHSPKEPRNVIESLRGLEGLTHYREKNPSLNREMWPTFVSRAYRAGITEHAAPDETTATRLIDALLTEYALDEEGRPILGANRLPTARLQLPADLNTKTTRTAIRQSILSVLTGLYVALAGMEETVPRKPVADTDRQTNPLTGY